MIKYEVFNARRKRIWLEQESDHESWVSIVEEIKLPPGHWRSSTIRVPLEGLRNAIAKITIRHEVAT